MNKSLLERAREFLRAHHRRHTWYKIVSALAVVVVFVTTYMLILPAITLETDNAEEVAITLVEEEGSAVVVPENATSDGSESGAENSTGNDSGNTSAAAEDTGGFVLTIEEIEEVTTIPETTAEAAAGAEGETDIEAAAGAEEETEIELADGAEGETELGLDSETEEETETEASTETEIETEAESETELDIAQLLAQITAQKLITIEAESIEEAGGNAAENSSNNSSNDSSSDSIVTIHWLLTVNAAQLDVSGWVLGGTVSVDGTEIDLDTTRQTISVTELAENGTETGTTASTMPYTFKTSGSSGNASSGESETAVYEIRFDTELEAAEVSTVTGASAASGASTAGSAVLVCTATFILPEQAENEESAIEIKSNSVSVAITAVETGTESETESETEVETENETGTETEIESENESGSESETESETETETETVAESGSVTDAETESETEIETETETETETEIKSESETETETESENVELANETLVSETYANQLLLGSDPSGAALTASLEEEDEEESGTEAATDTEEPDTEDATEDGTENGTEDLTEVESDTEADPNAGIALQAAEESGTAVDLTDYITSITFSQLNSSGIWEQLDAGETYEFAANTSLQFVLNYTITSGDVITSENNVLTYALPVGLAYDTTTSGYTTWNGKNVGEYSITQDESGNYVLKLVFYSDSEFFETSTAFSGKVKFISYVGSEASSTETTLTFIDEFYFTYTVTETQETEQSEINTDSSFNVEKSGNTATSANGDLLMHYDLEVTPGTYGATNVTFTDSLSVSVSGFDYTNDAFKNIVVEDNNGTGLKLIDYASCAEGTTTTETETDSDGNTTTVTTTLYTDNGTGNTCYSVITTTVTDSAGNVITTDTLTVPAAGYYSVVNNGDGTCTFILPDFEYDEQGKSVSPTSYTVSYDVDLSKLDSDLSVSNYNLNNSVYDGNGSSKDTNWASFSNSWVKKSSSMTTDSDGNYVINWTVTLNPDNKKIQTSDTFKDTISTALDPTAYGSELISITVTDANGNEITVTANDLSSGWDWDTIASGTTIAAILSALADADANFTYDSAAQTTDYSIVFNYTTTVSVKDLPNGYSTISNSATLSDGEGGTGSASGSQTMNNELVTKSCIGADYVEVTYITESGSDEETIDEVAKIQWGSTIKIPSADSIDADNLIIDAFSDNNLWTTAELLVTTTVLTITDSNGNVSEKLTLGADEDYIILNNSKDIQEYTGTNYSKLKLTDGFSIQFTTDGIEKLKEYAGEKISLQYYTYGTFSDLTADNTTRKFTNTISYNENNAFAEFSYSGSYFCKKYATDSGSGQTNEKEVTVDDEIWWRVETKLMEEAIGSKVTLIDELPAGIDLVSLEVTEYFGAGTTGVLTDFSEDGTAMLVYHDGTNYTVEVSVAENQDGTTTIAVTLPSELTAAVDRSGEHWFTLEIKAKVSGGEDINNYNSEVTSAYYTNTARMLVDGTEKNVSQQTVKVTNDKVNIEKTGALVDGTNNQVAYTLEVNKGQKTLNPDGNGTLKLEDTLTYNPDYTAPDGSTAEDVMSVELVSGEVHAYYYSSDGKWIELPDGSYDFSYTYGTTELTDGTVQNTLTMTIPDGLYIKVIYVYEMISSGVVRDLSAWSLSNKATLYGAEPESSESKKDYSYVESSSTVTKIPTFYKVDENNYNTLLDGATFTLWKYDPTDNNAVDGWVQVNKTVYESVNGKFDLRDIYNSLVKDTLYRLVETAAPTGYKRPDSPYTYFYLKGSKSASDLEKPSDVNAADITNMAAHDTVYIANSVDGSITVTKQWETEANSGFTADSITVALYMGTSSGYTYEDITDGTDLTQGLVKVNESVLITSGDAWTYTWSDLKTTDSTGLKLYYYVFEEKVNEDGTVSYSNGSYTVNGFSVDYANNGIQSGEITITNKPKSISVTKKWADGTPKSDVTFTLYCGLSSDLTYADITAAAGSEPVLTKVEDTGIENPKTIVADSGDDTVTWSGLPSEDSNGHAYYYYVFETSTSTTPAGTTVSETDQKIIYTSDGYQINGYWASYANNSGIVDGTITVTNSTKSISATKAWGTGTTAVDVAFTLYQGTSDSLTYADIAAGNLEFVASSSVTEGNPQTILASAVSAGDADWTVTWSGLPTVNADGKPLYYYVFETSIGGTVYTAATEIYDDSGKLTGYMVGNYYAEYSSTSGITDGTVTITNQDTSISVKKEWAGNNTTKDSVTMELYSSTKEPTDQYNNNEKLIGVYTGYTTSLTYGALYDGVYYSVVTSGYTIVGTAAGFQLNYYSSQSIELSADSISIACTNKNVEISALTVTGSGTSWVISWTAENLYDSCNFFIYVNGIDSSAGEYGWTNSSDLTITDKVGTIKNENLSMPDNANLVGTISLDGTVDEEETTAWMYTWNNLPLYDTDGNSIYYYIKEIYTGKYYASYNYSYNAYDSTIESVTVTNYEAPEEETEPQTDTEKQTEPETTSITVEKKWVGSDGSTSVSKQSGEISVNLYQMKASGSSGGSASGKVNVKLAYGDWNYDISNPVVDNDYKNGTVITVTVVSDDYGYNTAPVFYILDTNGSTLQTLDSDLKEEEWTATWGTTYTKKTWTYTITANEDLIVGGIGYSSSVSYEITEPSDTSTGSGNSGGTELNGDLYATFSINPSNTECTQDVDGTTITVKTSINSSGDTWTAEISGLPKQITENSTTYTYLYYLSENAVTNYKLVSTSNNDGISSGTITITNKKLETSDVELPETGGTGTTPYTYGGLLLTLSAAGLLVYKKKKHGKEVRSGPS